MDDMATAPDGASGASSLRSPETAGGLGHPVTPPVADRSFIATGLRRPSIETIRCGDEVFIVATVEDFGVSMLAGDPYISVMIGRLGSQRSITSAPLSSVTASSAYASARELQWTKSRLQFVEEKLDAITAVARQTPCPDWKAAVERIREILTPPAWDDEDDEDTASGIVTEGEDAPAASGAPTARVEPGGEAETPSPSSESSPPLPHQGEIEQ